MTPTPSSCFIEHYRKIVSRHSSKPALIWRGQTLFRHKDLWQTALALAKRIEQQVAPQNSTIALLVEHSPAWPVAVLACHLANKAFAPIDATQPKARRNAMLAQLATHADRTLQLTETDEETPPQALATLECRATEPFCQLKQGEHLLFTFPLEAPTIADSTTDRPITLDNPLAYVIFTSGSSGSPKGVAVPHQGLTPMLLAQIQTFQLDPSSRVLAFLPLCFDAAISDLGTTLLAGAALIMEPAPMLPRDKALLSLIQERKVTHADLPPALLAYLDPNEAPSCLKTIIYGGAVCRPSVVEKWAAALRLIVVYGPTEATICTSMEHCKPGNLLPASIGRPLPHLKYRVCNENGAVIEGDQPGELWISGNQLAMGYLSHSQQVAQRFCCVDQTRWYRTGDLVCRQKDGRFVFLGRMDRQFKVGGKLIAPEEIESALTEREDIHEAVVFTEDDSRLTAVIACSSTITPHQLRRELTQKLPTWMIPGTIHRGAVFPRTSSGKTDINALKAWSRKKDGDTQHSSLADKKDGDTQHSSLAETLPIGDTQPSSQLPVGDTQHSSSDASLVHQLCSWWQACLGPTPIHQDDHFFDLGGSSLLALRLQAKASQAGIDLPLRLLYENPTPRRLAKSLLAVNQTQTGRRVADLLDRLPKLDPLPTQPVSRRNNTKGLLITGATGKLGKVLLARLLKRDGPPLFLLLRSGARSKNSLFEKLQLEPDGKSTFNQRVTIIRGDYSQPLLGLMQNEYTLLARRIQMVHHLGAIPIKTPNFDEMWDNHVIGTANITAFCHAANASLVYASTLSVFSAIPNLSGRVRPDFSFTNDTCFADDYAATKWAGEQVVRESAIRAHILRLGLLDAGGVDHLVCRLMRALCLLRTIPNPLPRQAFDLTPTTAAAALIQSLGEETHNKHGPKVWHLANPNAVSVSQLISFLAQRGHCFEKQPVSAFLHRVKNSTTQWNKNPATTHTPNGQRMRYNRPVPVLKYPNSLKNDRETPHLDDLDRTLLSECAKPTPNHRALLFCSTNLNYDGEALPAAIPKSIRWDAESLLSTLYQRLTHQDGTIEETI